MNREKGFVKETDTQGHPLLLIVIGVASISLGLFISGFFHDRRMKEQVKIALTQSLIIEVSESLWNNDTDDNPLPTNENEFHQLLISGNLINLKPMNINDDTVIDSYGSPIHYSPPSSGGTDFHIWSNGPDKVNDNGLNDDISNKNN